MTLFVQPAHNVFHRIFITWIPTARFQFSYLPRKWKFVTLFECPSLSFLHPETHLQTSVAVHSGVVFVTATTTRQERVGILVPHTLRTPPTVSTTAGRRQF